jgi:hypothetical protein
MLVSAKDIDVASCISEDNAARWRSKPALEGKSSRNTIQVTGFSRKFGATSSATFIIYLFITMYDHAIIS